MAEAPHHWTECDDIVAVYIYKYTTVHLGISVEEITQRLGMTPDSMNMRIQNARAADGGIGLPNFARQTRVVLDRFGGLSEADLRAKVNACLAAATR